jgi:hypothetical protein
MYSEGLDSRYKRHRCLVVCLTFAGSYTIPEQATTGQGNHRINRESIQQHTTLAETTAIPRNRISRTSTKS